MIPIEDSDEQKDLSLIDANLILLFAQIYAFLSQALQQKLENSVISAEGLWYLATVRLLGGEATSNQLAKWIVRKPNSISAMTKRLEEKGFITKKKTSGTNNRVYLKIILTEKGTQFLEKQWGHPLVTAAFSSFTPEKKQQLRSLLLTVRRLAAQEVKGYDEPPFPSSETLIPDWEKLREEPGY